MKWNWQLPGWGEFRYDAQLLRPLEDQFLAASGRWQGTWTHMPEEERNHLRIEMMSQEAIQTSRIEGELLDRESVQASIRRLLGLPTQPARLKPREYGIAELTVSVYETYAQPLTHEQLYDWHRMLTQGRRDLNDIGTYRTHPEPMQILSGPLERPLVHFEAPPSIQVPQEMATFLTWFNRSQTQGPDRLPALARAGLAHLYFESIHPFEDGNGRIGRAIVEKVLSQAQGAPSLIMVADEIQRRQKAYYQALERASQSNDVDDWLGWFAQVIVDAQAHTQAALDLLLHQTKLLNRWGDQLHQRQVEVLKRLFRAGPQGFEGGLSAKNYQRITQASPATVTRDLADLVDKKILRREGARKGTRYYLVM